jgi:NDP-sugar pyrophosphorylase family protein
MTNHLANISGAILAGGLGTRLRDRVWDRPKVLADVDGRPYVTHLLDQLVDAGLSHVVLLTGYMGDMVRETLGETYAGLRLVYSCEPSPLGTAGALRLALPLLTSPATLLLNGDSYCDVSLAMFWDFHSTNAAPASLVLTWVDDTARFGRVHCEQERVVCFEEKRAGGAGWINAGVYLLSRNLIEDIPVQTPVSLERDFLPSVASHGCLCGFQTIGRFLDIGTPESYSMAGQFFRAA